MSKWFSAIVGLFYILKHPATVILSGIEVWIFTTKQHKGYHKVTQRNEDYILNAEQSFGIVKFEFRYCLEFRY